MSVLTAPFSKQSLNALLGDQRNHGKAGERISPPPAEPCIESEPGKQDRRQKRADRGLTCLSLEASLARKEPAKAAGVVLC
jgi:hypothetical protein